MPAPKDPIKCQQWKDKLRKALTGYKRSKEFIEKHCQHRHTKATKALIRAQRKGKAQRGTGWHHTEETKSLMREKAKGRKDSLEVRATKKAAQQKRFAQMSLEERKQFVKDHNLFAKGCKWSEEAKERKGQTVAELLVKGYCWKQGHFISVKSNKKIYYQSSYEKKALEILDTDLYVVSFDRCPHIVNYVFQNKKHHYVPDFLVDYINKCSVIIEVKPKVFVSTPQNVAKFQSVKIFCDQNNMTFEVWTEDQLFKI